MRNLTIKRTKSFVGCLGKMKVYIEDPLSSEMTINNTPCRKLGVLKNGEEKTFLIDENEAKVFVIADKLSKGFCNEYYKIPAGEEDVFLSGKNKFNPASGNAFRFDGITDEEILKNRKKGTKKGLVILVIAIIVGLLAGFAASSALFSTQKIEPKTFSTDEIEITLTNQFFETSIEGYTVCYDSETAGVFVLKEPFDLFDGFENYTLEEYGELVLLGNSFDPSIKLNNDNGLTYFEYLYTNPETNDTYYYFTALYKTSDAFWMLQFTTLEENAENYKLQIIDWAKSVEFLN